MTTIKNPPRSSMQDAAQRAREEAARRAQEEAIRRQAEAQRAQQTARSQAQAPAKPAAFTSGFVQRAAAPVQLAPSAPQLSVQGAGFSPASLQRMVASGQAPELSRARPYDVAGAASNLSGYRYAPEGDGTTVAEAVAEHVVRGGVATGKDGALNCTQAAYESQDYFARQNPPVQTEIVAADDHAVLRMPDGRYWDPSEAMLGQDGFLTPTEARPYEGVDGVTVAERRDLEAAATASMAALGSGATVDERLVAARTGAERRAGTLGTDGQAGEASATARANQVDVTGSEDPAALVSGSFAEWLQMPPVLPPPGTSASLLVEAPGQRYDVSVGTSNIADSATGEQVTVTLQAVAAGQNTGEFQGTVVEGSAAVFVGGQVSIELTMDRSQYDAWKNGQLATPINPMDPSSMPPGTGAMIRAEAMAGGEFEIALKRQHVAVFGAASTVASEGIAVGISNVSDPNNPNSNVMRVVLGPTEGVSNEMQLGVRLQGGGVSVSASLGRSDSAQSYDLVVADFDMNTPEGREAYSHFTRTGELPEASGTGARIGRLQQLDESSTASIGAELAIEEGEGANKGAVTLGGAIDWGTNAASGRLLTWDDGTVEWSMGGNTGTATVEFAGIDPAGDAPSTRTFTLGNTALGESESNALAMAFNGGQPVNFGGEVNFQWTLTDEDAMALRDDARAFMAWHESQFGYAPDAGSLQARLAAAETPDQVTIEIFNSRASPEYLGTQLNLMYTWEGSPLEGQIAPGVATLELDPQPE
jgi:hypothetical protein